MQFSQVRINKFVLIIVIFKNQVCGNDYLTGITLRSMVFTIYESILEMRSKALIEKVLNDSQSGFRKGQHLGQDIYNSTNNKEKQTY